MLRLAVSLLHHGHAETTLACVRSLLEDLEGCGEDVNLILRVADNGPAGPAREALGSGLTGLPGVTVTENEQNLGFAAGHNRNIAALLAGPAPDFIWLLNNDCTVRPGCIAALLRCAGQDPEVAIWGATLLEPDGETIQCAGVCFYNPWLGTYRALGAGTPGADRATLNPDGAAYVAGASMFFPARTLREGLVPAPGRPASGSSSAAPRPEEKPGSFGPWLNEEFFLYCEEIDLARRLRPPRRLGWCREAEIVHAGGLATGATEGGRTAVAEYHSVLSALKFASLYHPRRFWIQAPVLYLAKCVKLGLGGRADLLGAVTRAYRDGFRWRARRGPGGSARG